MRIFLYEYTCAQSTAGLPPSLCSEGRAMLAALVEEVERSGCARAVTLLHASQPADLGATCQRIETDAEERVPGTRAHRGFHLGDRTGVRQSAGDALPLDAGCWRPLARPDSGCTGVNDRQAHAGPTLVPPGYSHSRVSTRCHRLFRDLPAGVQAALRAGSQATFLVRDAAALAALLANAAALEQTTLGEALLQPFAPASPPASPF